VLVDDGSNKLAVLRNQQWSVTALVNNSSGSIAERYSYDHFGKRTIYAANGTTARTVSSHKNPYGYTSRRHDDETELMYYRARYYDPGTGEFISQDPLEYVDGMSQYRAYFVPGTVDPEGEKCTKGTPCDATGVQVCKERCKLAALNKNNRNRELTAHRCVSQLAMPKGMTYKCECDFKPIDRDKLCKELTKKVDQLCNKGKPLGPGRIGWLVACTKQDGKSPLHNVLMAEKWKACARAGATRQKLCFKKGADGWLTHQKEIDDAFDISKKCSDVAAWKDRERARKKRRPIMIRKWPKI
jgi:RHS repeat-associated protein